MGPNAQRWLPRYVIFRIEIFHPLHRTDPLILSANRRRKPLEDITQRFSNLGETETDLGWTKPDPKSKSKTKGTADPPNPDAAIVAPEVPPQQDMQPSFTVSKRAFKVFNTLFHIPTVADHAGQLPWIEFLHAMASTGCSVEKLHESVWQFTRSRLDVQNSISFHEPHPAGKIAFRTARHMGRRLQRAYRWEGGMFGVE